MSAQIRSLPARTPYHSLAGTNDSDALVVPDWAQHRSVYRSAGRTLYLVDTDVLGDAERDLRRIASAGWDVQVERDPKSDHARIAFTRAELPAAA